MKILVACEESQEVCKAFRAYGHESYSCDIQEPSGGHPEWHILGDALLALAGGIITTMDGEHHEVGNWDMLIAHPPCTYLTNAGAVRMRVNGEIVQERYQKALAAKGFFLRFLRSGVPKICVENPVPMKLVGLPAYTQIIQPYEHGEPYSKRTCLWLRGLQPLKPSKVVEDYTPYVNGGCKDAHGNYRRFQGRKERDPKTRAKTFPGIARAMAAQWG